jgi:cell division septal protein FtsQ
MIALVKKNPFLQSYTVSAVDIASSAAASMILADARESGKTIEVRLGIDRVAKKIDLLAGVLRQQSPEDISRIAYVDLRFKEPVIKLKENQKKEGSL